ncbi:MAG: hypothetical protein ACOY4M_08360 [Pseudomonadota bacterium]
MIVRIVHPKEIDGRLYLPGEYVDFAEETAVKLLEENIAVIDADSRIERKPAGEVKRANRKNSQ